MAYYNNFDSSTLFLFQQIADSWLQQEAYLERQYVNENNELECIDISEIDRNLINASISTEKVNNKKRKNETPLENPRKRIRLKTKRVKTTLRNEEYLKVNHFGYVLNASKAEIYSCFVGCCRFKSYNKKTFYQHLTKNHDDISIKQVHCEMCGKVISELKSVNDEFFHLISHIKRINEIQPKKRTLLRIESVESLNESTSIKVEEINISSVKLLPAKEEPQRQNSNDTTTLLNGTVLLNQTIAIDEELTLSNEVTMISYTPDVEIVNDSEVLAENQSKKVTRETENHQKSMKQSSMTTFFKPSTKEECVEPENTPTAGNSSKEPAPFTFLRPADVVKPKFAVKFKENARKSTSSRAARKTSSTPNEKQAETPKKDSFEISLKLKEKLDHIIEDVVTVDKSSKKTGEKSSLRKRRESIAVDSRATRSKERIETRRSSADGSSRPRGSGPSSKNDAKKSADKEIDRKSSSQEKEGTKSDQKAKSSRKNSEDKTTRKSSLPVKESDNQIMTKVKTEPMNETLVSYDDFTSKLNFQNLSKLYPWMDFRVSSQIIKTKTCFESLMTENSLFSTYKCMNQMCDFFSTDFESFKKHLNNYVDVKHFCSFCLKDFDKSDDLCSHIEKTHKFDRFQCNKCMYRSCQKKYVEIHQKQFHEHEKNCEIYKSPTQILTKSERKSAVKALKMNREQFVKPIRCQTPNCNKSFFSKNNLKVHLTSESLKSSNQPHLSAICDQLYNINNVRMNNTREGNTQCLFCVYGNDSEHHVLQHLVNNHPSQLAFVCKRKIRSDVSDEKTLGLSKETLDTHTTIESVGDCSVKAKEFTGDKEQLKTAKNDEVILKPSRVFTISEVFTIDDD